VEQPFLVVAEKCGISEDERSARVQKMKDEGIIRRIGAVFDGAKLGRVSTLCAARVPEKRIDNFVQIVNANKKLSRIITGAIMNTTSGLPSARRPPRNWKHFWRMSKRKQGSLIFWICGGGEDV